jgi:hypothetical protein
MFFEGFSIMKVLGVMLVGSDASVGAQYLAGGVLHFAVGIIYGIVYAVLIAPLKICTFFKGLIFGIVITGIAFFGMPILENMLAGDSTANPCNPCSMSMVSNPCNPCAIADNPCNPCNPCAAVVVTEVDVVVVNPCALEREEEAFAWVVLLLSFLNHFVFAFSLAYIYKMRTSKES